MTKTLPIKRKRRNSPLNALPPKPRQRPLVGVPVRELPKPRDIRGRVSLTGDAYMAALDRVIEGVYLGGHIRELIMEDNKIASFEKFFTWLRNNDDMWARYMEAKRHRAELLSEDILNISEGKDCDDPTASGAVARDKLRIETRLKIMAFDDRPRFGEVKQIEVGGSISITAALEQATARALSADEINAEVVEAKEPKLLGGDIDTGSE